MSPDEDLGMTPEQVEAVENMALNPDGEETVTPEAPTTGDQKTTEEANATGSEGVSGDGQLQPEGDSKAEEDEGRHQGRPDKQSRAQQRISGLTSKLREKDEYIDGLEQELNRIRKEGSIKPPTRDEDGNINADDLMEYNRQQAELAADEKVVALERKLEGEQVATRFDREEADILRAYPMLDPNNAHLDPSDPNAFNEKLAAAVFGNIQDKLGPHLRARNVKALGQMSPKAIADAYMVPVLAMAEAERNRLAGNLSSLNGQSSGMFSTSAPRRSDGNSIEELEARIGDISLA